MRGGSGRMGNLKIFSFLDNITYVLDPCIKNGSHFFEYCGHRVHVDYVKDDHLIFGCDDKEIIDKLKFIGNKKVDFGLTAEYLIDMDSNDDTEEYHYFVEWHSNPTNRIETLKSNPNIYRNLYIPDKNNSVKKKVA